MGYRPAILNVIKYLSRIRTYLANDKLEIGKVFVTVKHIAAIVESMKILHTATVDDEFFIQAELFSTIVTLT